MTALVRVLALVWHAHRVYPGAPIADVAVAAIAAGAAETRWAPAEVLLAIAEHESDLRPRAVSWRRSDGVRVDHLVENPVDIPDRTVACGLVQSIARGRAGCAELLDPMAAMRAGAAELEEELAACRGSMTCALSIYAGGHAGRAAWLAGDDTDATRFAYLFARRARALGWHEGRPGS